MLARIDGGKWPRPSIALTSVTGPDEAWRLTGYEAFEAWNEDLEATSRMPVFSSVLELLDREEGSLLRECREITAVYHPEISYRPTFDWAKMRFLDVITIQLRPGHHAEYLQNRKLVMDAHERAALDEHILIYTVILDSPTEDGRAIIDCLEAELVLLPQPRRPPGCV